MNSLFYQLIRVAIGTQEGLSQLPSQKEWKALYDMAKKQSLVGVCFAALQRLGADADEGFARIGMSEMLYLTWMGMTAKIQQRNQIVNEQCMRVQRMIEKDGFRTFIMKGQGNAALYKTSGDLFLLRQPGDIDIYLNGGFKKVYEFVQRTCPTKEVNRQEIQYHCLENTDVEIHYKPFYMPSPGADRKLQAFFHSCENDCFENKVNIGLGEISVPTREFNLVHQMAHIWHHFFTEGVGMRQLMDYYFVLQSGVTENEKQHVNELFAALGIKRFAAGVMNIMQTVFGMEEDWLLLTSDPEAGAWILSEVMQKGNFGHLSDDNLMKKPPLERLWIKTRFAIRYRSFGHSAWFWIPVRSMTDRIWQWRHGFKM